MGDVEDAEAALLQPGQKVVRDTFGTGIGAGRIAGTEPASPPAAASVSTEGEVLVAVARTDAPLDEVMRTIQQALKDHWAGACWPNRSVDTPNAGRARSRARPAFACPGAETGCGPDPPVLWWAHDS